MAKKPNQVTITQTAELKAGVAEVYFPIEPEFEFQSGKPSDSPLQFYAPLRDPVSMAHVSVQFCDALVKRLGKIAIQNYTPGRWLAPHLKNYEGYNPEARLGIFYGVPDHVPESFFSHQHTIGCFVCETDRITDDWVNMCNRFELILVPSQWCRKAFEDSGVSSEVMVVSHGLEPEYRPVHADDRPQQFTFFNTFHASSYNSRKSLEELVRTFLETFNDTDEVVLRLRTQLSADLRRLQVEYDFGDRIQVDTDMDKSIQSFAEVYSQVHCTVHPSKGEGFGFIPFQSIACETPVIAPYTTGMADYLNSENSVELKTNGRVRGKGVGNATGTYFSIDETHLSHCMRYMVENWQAEREKCKQVGDSFRQRYAWPKVLADFLLRVDSLLPETDSQRFPMNPLP